MLRRLFIIMVAIILFTVSYFKFDNDSNLSSSLYEETVALHTTPQADINKYFIESYKYINIKNEIGKFISIQYPQIFDYYNYLKIMYINNAIKDTAFEVIGWFESFDEMTIVVEYNIMRFDNKIISIYFSITTSHLSQARNLQRVKTINFCMITGNRLMLLSLIYICDCFISTFMKNFDLLRPSANEEDLYIINQDVMRQITVDQLRSADTYKSEIYSFITQDCIGIVFHVRASSGHIAVYTSPILYIVDFKQRHNCVRYYYEIIEVENKNLLSYDFYNDLSFEIAQMTFLEVMLSNAPFQCNGRGISSMYLNQFFPPNECDELGGLLAQFALVDMDGDGVYEVVINDTFLNAKTILRYYNGQIYGHGLFFRRTLSWLMVDGSFLFSGGAAVYGIERLGFLYNYHYRVVIAFYNGNCSCYDAHVCHYINGNIVTRDEFLLFFDTWQNTDEVTWHEFTKENVMKFFAK